MNKLLKFGSSHCGPCRSLSKILESNNIVYENIDVDDDYGIEMSEKYRVFQTPTLILVDEKGEEIKRTIGIISINEIKDTFNV